MSVIHAGSKQRLLERIDWPLGSEAHLKLGPVGPELATHSTDCCTSSLLSGRTAALLKIPVP